MAEVKTSVKAAEHLMQNVIPDCVLIVEGQEFRCHKSRLIASSEFFERMFNGNFKEAKGEKSISLEEVEATIFKKYLDFIYTADRSRLELFSVDILLKLLALATKYIAEELKMLCNEILIDKMPFCEEKDLLALFSHAHFTDDKKLIEFAGNHIKTVEIINYANTFGLESSVFYELTKIVKGSLSEKERFILIEAYAEANELGNVDKKNIEIDKKESPEVCKYDLLRLMLQTIDYKEMNTVEFITGPGKSNLIDLQEKYDILSGMCRHTDKIGKA